MADPLSIAGLAIGGVGLAFQVFEECLKCYRVFAAAVDMPQDCRSMAVNLKIQYGRLKKWGQVAGLIGSKDGSTIAPGIRMSYLPLVAIFTEIRTLMHNFARINSKYIELQDDESVGKAGELHDFDEEELQQAFDSVVSPFEEPATSKRGIIKASKDVAKGIGGVFRHPKRLQWAAFKKEDFIKLLKRLEQLIDCLNEFLTRNQLEKLEQTTNDTYLEMVQVRNDISDLALLVEAASGHISEQRRGEANLVKLARFKLLRASVSKKATSLEPIPSENITLKSHGRVATGRREAIFKPMEEMQPERHIWVEWREYSLQYEDDGQLPTNPEIIKRVKELAVLLTSTKPDEFCIPPCIGYFLDEKIIKKPSLTNRIVAAHKIANCILYLHSVDWLHKGIRSENIICFASRDGLLRTSDPYLTGFDYSRPAREGERTERTPVKPRLEVYRHPDIQGEGPKPYYRKTFDIYSLGIVLLELAFWQSIDGIMKISNIESARPAVTEAVRERILSEGSDVLETLRAEVGDKYHDVVKFCIRGRDSFGIDEEDEETSPATGVLLQQRFGEEVVRKLQSLVV